MPKRIIVCFDGTWNAPGKGDDLDDLHDQGAAAPEAVDPKAGIETNVCRLYRSIKKIAPAAGATGQIKWYDKGVGTNWYDRVGGGAFGLGLSRNIREGYKYLSDNYEDGDEIYVFGFSRGAYTARSLVGFIRNCGLLPKGSLPAAEADKNSVLMEAYEIYRTRDGSADSERALDFRRKKKSAIVKVKCLGVWDTVGALGIPIESFSGFNKEQFQFHDTALSSIVENAFHALAIDEHREPYAVTMWDPQTKPNQTIEQRWFLGAHCDVGGGYEDRRLSDIALRWMQERAAGCGLALDPAGVPKVTPKNYEAPISDSFGSFLHGVFSLFQKRFYRAMLKTQFGYEAADDTARERQKIDIEYRPRNPGFPYLET